MTDGLIFVSKDTFIYYHCYGAEKIKIQRTIFKRPSSKKKKMQIYQKCYLLRVEKRTRTANKKKWQSDNSSQVINYKFLFLFSKIDGR